MSALSYARHHFPPSVIQHAIWLYLRFTLSYRDVEEPLAERGIEVSYETVRRWVVKFGPAIAGNLRRLRPKPSPRWHLDEMVVRIGGQLMYLWWAVDDEGEVLEVLVQRGRDQAAALKLMRKLLKKHGFAPVQITTDKLRSYGAAFNGSVHVTKLSRPIPSIVHSNDREGGTSSEARPEKGACCWCCQLDQPRTQ